VIVTIEPIYDRPGLYDEVLPRYEFAGMADEELLTRELEQLLGGHPARRVLELGCGTGRMTGTIRRYARELMCVDNSAAMLSIFRTHHPDIIPVHADARDFVTNAHHGPAPPAFDLIVACWSLNYPLLACFETNTGKAIAPRDLQAGRDDAAAFLTTLVTLLTPGGHLLALFFDPDSPEQRLVTDIWETVAPFPGTGRDFTRQLLLDHLNTADGTVAMRHDDGHMVAPDIARAERWFLHGHLKSFPTLVDDPEIRDTVRVFLTRHTGDDGTVRVSAGIYMIAFTRA
jgi:SAM-dependent methyltransferase